jgi:HPt (histidine-containing phosphotransfer) domain-containing protein
MSGSSAGAVVDDEVCPIDHAHLRRYTMGSRPLEIEVLQLFAGQAPSTLADLMAAADAKAWHIAAHTLKGSARAVGAFAVAQAAEKAERAGFDHPDRAQMLAAVAVLLDDARAYIDGLS